MRGFSLIEVLVSMVVVSVGALSVASLQLVSKRAVRDAGQRLEATQLAHGLLERMNANSSMSALQTYVATASPYLGLGRISAPSIAVPTPRCRSDSVVIEPCTPEQLAQLDLWLWERLLDGATEQAGGADVGGLLFPTACLLPPAAGAGAAGNYTLVIAFRGTAALPNNPAIACGSGAAFSDGARLYGDSDEYRRAIIVQAFITPAAPK